MGRVIKDEPMFGHVEEGEGQPLRNGQAGWYEVKFASETVVRAWGSTTHDAVLRGSRWRDARLREVRRTVKGKQDETPPHDRVLVAHLVERAADRSEAVTVVSQGEEAVNGV